MFATALLQERISMLGIVTTLHLMSFLIGGGNRNCTTGLRGVGHKERMEDTRDVRVKIARNNDSQR